MAAVEKCDFFHEQVSVNPSTNLQIGFCLQRVNKKGYELITGNIQCPK